MHAAFAALAVIATMLWTPAANAYTGTGTVLADPSLNIRSSASTSAKVVGSIPYKTKVTITCTTTGTAYTGPYGTTTIWDKVTYKGVTGYVTDALMYTGTNGAAASPCAASTPAPSAPSGPWYGTATCTRYGASSPGSYAGFAACTGGTTAAIRYGAYCYGNGCRNGTDGPYPSFQCVELTGRYMYARTGRVVWADGRYFAARNSKNRSGLRLSAATRYKNSTLKTGAVISMWHPNRGGTGHVAIVTSVTAGRVYILEQNHNGGKPGQAAVARKGVIDVASNGVMSYGDGYYNTFQWLTGM